MVIYSRRNTKFYKWKKWLFSGQNRYQFHWLNSLRSLPSLPVMIVDNFYRAIYFSSINVFNIMDMSVDITKKLNIFQEKMSTKRWGKMRRSWGKINFINWIVIAVVMNVQSWKKRFNIIVIGGFRFNVKF